MEYSIKKMAVLSGVSTRTLRYYDEIGLLRPHRMTTNGYRIYGQAEVNRLQQILLYRELGIKLEEIKAIVDDPDFNIELALQSHYQQLLAKRQEIDELLMTVQQTMKLFKGEITMTDQEKFKAFKEKKLLENEQLFGTEIREKYGKERVEQSNQHYLNLTEDMLQNMEQVEKQLFEALADYIENPHLESEMAKRIFTLHKEWLSFSWPTYSSEAHKGLGIMYVSDERFTNYYDEKVAGAAQFLNEIIQKYA